MKRLPKSLIKMDVPREHYEAIRHRFREIVQARADNFSGYRPLIDQLEELAFDCYTQGVLDGAQVGGKNGLSQTSA